MFWSTLIKQFVGPSRRCHHLPVLKLHKNAELAEHESSQTSHFSTQAKFTVIANEQRVKKSQSSWIFSFCKSSRQCLVGLLQSLWKKHPGEMSACSYEPWNETSNLKPPKRNRGRTEGQPNWGYALLTCQPVITESLMTSPPRRQ